MKKAFSTLAAGLALLALSFNASALTIDQDILIFGTLNSFTTNDNGSTGTITFLPSAQVGAGSINLVSLSGSAATLGDLTLPVSASGNPTIWSISNAGTTYSFRMGSLTSYSNQSNASLPGYLSRTVSYSGFGTVSDGFEAADAQVAVTQVLTYNLDKKIWTGGQVNLTVSAVPIPAAGWLFGSALLGLAGVARRKNLS